MTSLPLLRIQDLQVAFAGQGSPVIAVKGISMDVHRGEWVALVGESGSGKSVTALSVLGLLPTPPVTYPSGRILLELGVGKPVTDLLGASPEILRGIRGSEVSMIFQEPMTSLNPVFTCGEQVAETLRHHLGLSRKEAREHALASMAEVLLPDPGRLYDRYPHQLSGGQKQRIMIAMAICCRPSLLIADEPTTALDVTVQAGIVQLLKRLQQERNMGILFITHDLGLVRDVADRCVLLYRGRILEEGPVPSLFDAPTHPYTKALLACRPAGAPKNRRLPVVEDFWREDGSPLTSAQAPAPVAPARTASTPLLEVENLRVWFPGNSTFGLTTAPVKAVDGVSFTVLKGEILGLVGESGSGKTTLGRALLQLVPTTAGRVLFQGDDLARAGSSALKTIRQRLQIVFQDPFASLNPRMTLGQALEEVLRLKGSASGVSPVGRVRALLEQVRLGPAFANRYPHECSGGQRQRAVIARALAVNPGFILFDESVSALDVSVQAQILNLIADLRRELGFTALFISHDLSVVRYLCDRIMVMRAGRIEETGDAEVLYHHPQTAYTRSLLAAIPGQRSVPG